VSEARGGCLCGAVRFRVEGPLRDVVVCHCSLCRRSGTLAGAYASCPREALRLLRSGGLAWYVDVNGRSRGFCRTCGSSLFWSDPARASISIAAGSLVTPTGLVTAAHIHLESRADWEEPPDAAPKRLEQ
jgi:hypothetical protein